MIFIKETTDWGGLQKKKGKKMFLSNNNIHAHNKLHLGKFWPDWDDTNGKSFFKVGHGLCVCVCVRASRLCRRKHEPASIDQLNMRALIISQRLKRRAATLIKDTLVPWDTIDPPLSEFSNIWATILLNVHFVLRANVLYTSAVRWEWTQLTSQRVACRTCSHYS